ncbi:restriction endonuclease [Macrococcus bovicus]|uniref:restriction endonuclease n=1 Tax=Macrococcus bovicus TaxID=69968 RepID=UPI0025A5C14A|nr:restriction endonuclease [Macrococcus bovicus]WJP97388.1 restriction endonuclease [Macrococcus bovicus]
MYLMQRVSHHAKSAEKMLEAGYLPIGWAAFRKHDLELADQLIALARDNTMSKYEFGQHFKELSKTTPFDWLTPRQGYFLHNFFSLSEDSIVIVPKAQVFDVYKVMGNPQVFSPEKTGIDSEEDIGFMVQIQPLHRNVSRYDYLETALMSKLKFRGTNLVFSDDDVKLILNMLKHIEESKPIDDFSETKAKIITEIRDYIYRMGYDKLEHLIKAYMKHIGADCVRIPSKNDKGDNDQRADVDIKASFKNLGIVIYIQAKCHDGISDTLGIEQLLAYETEIDSDFAELVPVKWFITTGDFEADIKDQVTESYSDKKEELKNIKLINGTDFAEMLYDSGFVFGPDVFKK